MYSENEMERKTYLYDAGDGLLDIYAASVLLAFGLGIRFDIAWLAGVFAAALYPALQSARSRITSPRSRRKRRPGDETRPLWMIVSLLFGVLLLGLNLFVLFTSGDIAQGIRSWLQVNLPLTIGVILALFLASLGAALGAQRFYLYAVATLVFLAAANFLEIPLWMAVTALGAFLLMVGFFILARCVSQNPVQDE